MIDSTFIYHDFDDYTTHGRVPLYVWWMFNMGTVLTENKHLGGMSLKYCENYLHE